MARQTRSPTTASRAAVVAAPSLPTNAHKPHLPHDTKSAALARHSMAAPRWRRGLEVLWCRPCGKDAPGRRPRPFFAGGRRAGGRRSEGCRPDAGDCLPATDVHFGLRHGVGLFNDEVQACAASHRQAAHADRVGIGGKGGEGGGQPRTHCPASRQAGPGVQHSGCAVTASPVSHRAPATTRDICCNNRGVA
ncbi:hypothetical protein BU14_0218s0022 [Porphyra umbilicalis]|uniref:Uncharacterized protein n=1 Tax=Porphyra umbilicalis TaxID=2786 RepID=A0A1X6P519_PORUM|nr:hypothetical protein BU14_0218s0022 [Porphyra umbilicalis]|eukprot:OSX75856.1 hypothetical protein BU14_0218s0022 [Porphyra umbilicalis]